MPLPNDGTAPKPKTTQADLSSFLRNPISSKDNEDTSKEPSLSTHKYSGQTLTLSATPTSQSTGDSLLAAVSP